MGSKCPGQDGRNVDVQTHTCAQCGYVVEMFSDEVKHVEEIKTEIEDHIERAIGIRVKVTLVEPKSIPRSEGKAKRVFDMREMK